MTGRNKRLEYLTATAVALVVVLAYLAGFGWHFIHTVMAAGMTFVLAVFPFWLIGGE